MNSFVLKNEIEYENGGRSLFFENGDAMIIVDCNICAPMTANRVFAYNLLTDAQNKCRQEYDSLQRILSDDVERMMEENGIVLKEGVSAESNELMSINMFFIENTREVSDLLKHVLFYSSVPSHGRRIADRSEYAGSSPLEISFEQNFAEVYGSDAVRFLEKEYPIVSDNGNTYLLDYLVHTDKGDIAVEENGISYHHPQIIGKERYRKQLYKQNLCDSYNIRLYRFSSIDCSFRERIQDDIKRYFGDRSHFIENGVRIGRTFKLYEHQENYLEEMERSRAEGIEAFLIVLPTASGKSKIIETDIKRFSDAYKDSRFLILAPSRPIVDDWKERVQSSLAQVSDRVTVSTFAHMWRHYRDYPKDHYSYICIDEAHHAVSPMNRKVIEYFSPRFLVGITATDKRPDKKQLETVFGSYTTQLSLREAMEKNIIAKARAFRIETNLDLSEVRVNGKDYVNADLEKKIRVTSRNELIADVLKEYFCQGNMSEKQGVVFCISQKHARDMAQLLNESGISAEAVGSGINGSDKKIEQFRSREFRFLCSCNMISEGWDYPELGILVMARPTLSRVLYLQQLGRGLRKAPEKECVYVIDVVDEYGSSVMPCSLHSVFHNPYYVPFGDITRSDYRAGDLVEVDGLVERIERITEINIESFDDKYGEYLSTEQLARQCYVSTGTVTNWLKKGRIKPTVSFSFGAKLLHMFSPEDAGSIMVQMGCTEHNDDTVKADFYSFLEERDYTLSYKMPFLLGLLRHMNDVGEASIDDILDDYIKFYRDRLDAGLPVDRPSCPYNETTLADRKYIKRSMLTNPFEKFERKRFMYYSKELGMIAVNHALFDGLSSEDLDNIRRQMEEDLEDYYKGMGGLI